MNDKLNDLGGQLNHVIEEYANEGIPCAGVVGVLEALKLRYALEGIGCAVVELEDHEEEE